MNKKKVGKCFEYADSENIKFISIIGSNEINSQIIKVKNLKTKEEFEVKLADLTTFLQKHIDN